MTGRVLLTCRGKRQGMLLNMLWCTGQPHKKKILTKNTHKHSKAQHCTQLVRLWGNKHSCLQLVEMPNGTSTVMGNWRHLTKLCMGLSLHPVILLLGIYPEDIPPMVWKYTLTKFFIVALFVFAKFWNWSNTQT